MSLNKWIGMGRLTADPELRQTASNVSNVKFTVAVDRNYTPQGQEKQTDFISVVAWRQTAEFINKYFAKGSMIVVEGSLQTGSFTDKNGVKRYTTDVIADQVYFAESKKNAEKPQQNSSQDKEQLPSMAIGNLEDFEEIIGGDDLPF